MQGLRLVNLVCLGIFLVLGSTFKSLHAEESLEGTAESVIMEGFTPELEEQMAAKKESFEFQAEVSRLMDIIINSLYKNREVFLRELISNASDALDKLRFLSVSNNKLMDEQKDMDIKISFNEDLKTLTIKDSGIGMTKNELVNNLGTLAKSGTKKFLESMQEGADMGLIGQFGVGFYSVYLVADKVRVITKNPEDVQYIWESTAEASFTVAEDPRGNTLGRGTEITMFLKEDALEFLQQEKLEEIVKKHSEFITFPISLYKKTTEMVEVEEDEEEKEPKVDEDGIEIADEDEEPKEPKTEKVETWNYELLNGDVAIWSRDPKEITDDEYQKFYKVITKETADAQTWIHFKAEGEVEFKSILYIPEDAGNFYDDYSNRKAGVRLYVKKVLIQDDFEELLPKYLNFIRGVTDSDDLPLNVSRETLQQHKILKVMSKKLVRKVLEMLRKLASGKKTTSDEDGEIVESEDEDKEDPYIKFWEQFGKSIKMGIIEDTANRSKLAKLLRYKSSKSGDGYVSLDEYVANKPEWQKGIYYIAGESMEACKKSPFVETAVRKGVEVIYMSDPIDEYAVQNLQDFDGYKLQSLTKEGLKFGDENEEDLKKRNKLYKESFKPLTTFLKELLTGKVSKVSVSQRVETTPSVIVTGQYGHTANMERIMRAQTFANPDTYKMMQAQKTLEINPRHPLVAELKSLVESDSDNQRTKDLAYILYDTALMSSGFTMEDTEEFSARMFRTLASSLKVESMDLLPELEIPEEEEEDSDAADEALNDEF